MALLTRTLLAVLLLLGLVAVAGAVSPGDTAPDVRFVALDGKEVDLRALRGRVVVLDFWATWCSPCVDQLRGLDAVLADLADGGVVVVAASIDDGVEEPKRFLAEKFPGRRFRGAHDPGGEALASFGADGIPALYVLDAAGIVRHSHFGPGGADDLRARLGDLAADAPSAPGRGPVD